MRKIIYEMKILYEMIIQFEKKIELRMARRSESTFNEMIPAQQSERGGATQKKAKTKLTHLE